MKLANQNFAQDGSVCVARRLRQIVLSTAVVSLAALAGGCANYGKDPTPVGAVPDDYRTRHPIVVSQSEVSEDIIVSATASMISFRDKGVVLNFVQRFKRSGVQSMAILIPTGSPNEAAARRIAHQTVDIMREQGVSDNRIRIQHYAAASHGDAATLRLVYGDITAHVPSHCGQWPKDVLDDLDNRNYSNFGCATQHNLAAMVANPADLLGPRGESEIDASRRTTVIEEWREGGSSAAPILF